MSNEPRAPDWLLPTEQDSTFDWVMSDVAEIIAVTDYVLISAKVNGRSWLSYFFSLSIVAVYLYYLERDWKHSSSSDLFRHLKPWLHCAKLSHTGSVFKSYLQMLSYHWRTHFLVVVVSRDMCVYHMYLFILCNELISFFQIFLINE